jgi:hypothetical protein
MRVSLNEVEATCRKAAAGAGCPHGTAAEIGHAAAWLAARGLDGAGAALAGLEGGWPVDRAAGAGRAIRGGLVALDYCRAGLAHAALACDAPALMVGLAAVACGPDEGLALTFGGGATVRVGAAGFDGWDGARPLDGEFVITNTPPPAAMPVSRAGAEVDPAIWERLTALAQRTYVPESDTSRQQGAGAGLLDND